MILIYLIIFTTISKYKLQQQSYRDFNDSYNKRFIDSLERDYNLNQNMYGYEVVNNGYLKNPIRIKYFKGKAVWAFMNSFGIYDFSKLIGVKYRPDKNLLIPRNCDKYIKGSNEICATKCKLASCYGLDAENDWSAECKYLGPNNRTEIIPEGNGLKDTDLVMNVLDDNQCGTGRETYIEICSQGMKGRPIFGAIKFCRSEINIITQRNKNRIRARFIHDMLQIMGFGSKLMTSFVKQDGSPYLDKSDPNWRKKSAEDIGIMKRISRPRESVSMNYTKASYVFTLENSGNFVRKHFNCSDLEGIDMVMNFNEQWTFDQLKYGEDIMSTKLNPYINDITMLTAIFLEDTGWYYVDHSQVNQFYNGRGLGCTFAKGGCYSYMKDKTGDNLRPYCDVPINSLGHKYVCSGNQKYYLSCDLRETNLQDSKYVYFKSLKGVDSNKVKDYSGSDVESEYCPLYKQILDSNFNGKFLPAECNHKIVNSDLRQNLITDYYGDDSKCLEYKTQQKGVNYGATCFKITNENENSFNFEFNKSTYKCYYNKIVEVEKDAFKYQIDCGERQFTIVPIISISNINHANSFFILIAISMNMNSVF